MEDTLRGYEVFEKLNMQDVLILVLMEDTLRAIRMVMPCQKSPHGLNPCFNGRYSQRNPHQTIGPYPNSLNPCFNGRYSQRAFDLSGGVPVTSLNPCFNGRYSQRLSSITLSM